MHYDKGIICGIDPGTINLGFSIIEVDLFLSITNIKAITFASEILDDSKRDYYSRIKAQKENLLHQFYYYRPFAVACEGSFYNSFRPSAFKPLIETIQAIRESCAEYNGYECFFIYEPKLVKKATGAIANPNKYLIKQAIINNQEIKNAYNGDINRLSEHSIDSIAIGYTHLRFLRGEIWQNMTSKK